MRREGQRDAGEPGHGEGGKGRELYVLRAGQATAGQALWAGAVVVSAADAIGIIIGVVHADNKSPRDDEGEERAAHVAAVDAKCRAGARHDGRERISPGMWARALEPILGSGGETAGGMVLGMRGRLRGRHSHYCATGVVAGGNQRRQARWCTRYAASAAIKSAALVTVIAAEVAAFR